MIIKINEDYQIKIESHNNHTLLKFVRDDSGAIKLDKDNLPVMKQLGFYPSVRHALNAAIHLMIRDNNDVMELSQYLDELDRVKPEKVVIPKFVADWLGKSARECDYEPIRMAEWIADNIGEGTDYHFDWLENPDNQRLLLTALINNYEIEKESKYQIKLPGLAGSNGQQYISKSADGTLFACAQRNYLQQEFTGDELKQLPDWVRRLELEEVGRK